MAEYLKSGIGEAETKAAEAKAAEADQASSDDSGSSSDSSSSDSEDKKEPKEPPAAPFFGRCAWRQRRPDSRMTS